LQPSFVHQRFVVVLPFGSTPEYGRFSLARADAFSILQWKPRSPKTSLIAHANTSSSPDELTPPNLASIAENSGFGSDPYCKEELIAEMGAAFLCGQAEIVERTIDSSAAYIKG